LMKNKAPSAETMTITTAIAAKFTINPLPAGVQAQLVSR
jgi:hypothetical protein